MRKVCLSLAAVVLLSTSMFASNVDPIKGNTSNVIAKQIAQLLSENSFTVEDVNLTAQVRFTVNKDSEIVVLSVDSKNDKLEQFVKNRLNYFKLKNKGNSTEGKLYTIPVRIKN